MSENIIGSVVHPSPQTIVEHDPKPSGSFDFNWLLLAEQRAPVDLQKIDEELKDMEARKNILLTRRKIIEKIVGAFTEPLV